MKRARNFQSIDLDKKFKKRVRNVNGDLVDFEENSERKKDAKADGK